MKFKIKDVTYDMAALDLLSLKDILMLEKETTELGKPLRWCDVTQMTDTLAALKTDEERKAHPDSLWMTAITIWASRRVVGEDQAFGDAIDFPLRDLTWLEEPQDRKKPARPTKPARTRAGSGRAVKRPVAAATASAGTSGEASTPV
jgi:hypothetical protein